MNHHLMPPLRLWIGHDVAATPYLSPIGQIIRLSRLNRIRTHQIDGTLGVGPAIASALRGNSPLPWPELCRWQQRHHAGALGWDAFLPFQPFAPETLGAHLRVCLACARYGYHTVAHQLRWISACPWHRTRLYDRCTCGRRWLSAKPEGVDDRLLACPCGRDAFNRRQGLLGMRRFPADAIRTQLDGLLAKSRQEASYTTLLTVAGVDHAKAYADVIETGRSRRAQLEATGDVSETRTRDELISAVRAIGNGQGSVVLPAAYESRIRSSTVALLVKERHHQVGPCPLVVSDVGVFLHRMPVMSRWPGEPQARLHRWSLSADWTDLVGRLLQVSLIARALPGHADTGSTVDDRPALARLLDALYELLCLDSIAYLAAALSASNRLGPTTRHPPPRHRLVALSRRQPTSSLLVDLTRTS